MLKTHKLILILIVNFLNLSPFQATSPHIDNLKFLNKINSALHIQKEEYTLKFFPELNGYHLNNSTILSYASCYWIDGFNLFDITPLKSKE